MPRLFIFTTIVTLYFPNYVYPKPTLSTFLGGGKRSAQANPRLKAGFHCSHFARAGGAGFENLLTRA
jgi:hypothetical protein